MFITQCFDLSVHFKKKDIKATNPLPSPRRHIDVFLAESTECLQFQESAIPCKTIPDISGIESKARKKLL